MVLSTSPQMSQVISGGCKSAACIDARWLDLRQFFRSTQSLPKTSSRKTVKNSPQTLSTFHPTLDPKTLGVGTGDAPANRGKRSRSQTPKVSLRSKRERPI